MLNKTAIFIMADTLAELPQIPPEELKYIPDDYFSQIEWD